MKLPDADDDVEDDDVESGDDVTDGAQTRAMLRYHQMPGRLRYHSTVARFLSYA